MADEKLFSAKDAAVAVLKKAEELLKSSAMNKALNGDIGAKISAGFNGAMAGGTPPPAPVSKSEGVQKQVAPEDSKEERKEGNNPAPGAFPQNEKKYSAELKKDAPAVGATLGSKIGYPGAPPTAPIAKEEGAPAEAPMKGHIKLAKFMGRMEHKRGATKPTGHEKGVHPQQGQLGMSPAGNLAVDASSPHSQEKAKDMHRQVLKETKELGQKDRSGMGKSETGHEKGVHRENKYALGTTPGKSNAGDKLKVNGPKSAKEEHKKVLGELKAMPKPKLGKGE